MKKILSLLFIILAIGVKPLYASENMFFGKYTNQITINIGTGVNSGIIVPPPTQFVPFSLFQFQYSQPTRFMRLAARQSVNVLMTVGYGEKYGWDWNAYSIPIVLLSEDAILLHGQKWYAGTGLGIGMQGKQNERIGSKLLFGFKLFAGYSISENMNAEFFIQHFSNGNTAPENNSYAFYGLGLSYNF